MNTRDAIIAAANGGRGLMDLSYYPTQHLRFIERQHKVPGESYPRTVRILQQWWMAYTGTAADRMRPDEGGVGEWRDIPMVSDGDGS